MKRALALRQNKTRVFTFTRLTPPDIGVAS
jgi:hypothetical protein